MGKKMSKSISQSDFGLEENIDEIRPPYFGKRGSA